MHCVFFFLKYEIICLGLLQNYHVEIYSDLKLFNSIRMIGYFWKIIIFSLDGFSLKKLSWQKCFNL